MNPKGMARLFFAAAVATVLLVCALPIQPASNVNAAGVAHRNRSTLRVGMWTLWRDREVTLESAGSDSKVTLRTCEGCVALRFAHPVEIRANGGTVALGSAGKAGHARQICIEAPVKLAAHGETVTLRNFTVVRYPAQ